MAGGVPGSVRWLAFAGWLVVPVAAAWAAYALGGLPFLWTGPLWLALAVLYMALYFRWVRRRGGPD